MFCLGSVQTSSPRTDLLYLFFLNAGCCVCADVYCNIEKELYVVFDIQFQIHVLSHFFLMNKPVDKIEIEYV